MLHTAIAWRRTCVLALLFAVAAPAAAADDPPPPPGDHAGFDAALRDCAAEQGLPPPARGSGEKRRPPTDGKRPDRAKMDQCLKAKGFEPPPHRDRPPPRAWDDEDE
ncbi:hypothetical protein [Lysobacter sp.]|uniref:hypothetical protein n=1 Tax=Lysobacter sp. TaxID=72226 RepID=UPI002D56B49E|nr:hypothetical protein [Lysobacter sp.]HZX76374.1 hypothetical protein [Lysobacter sp.]